MKIGIGGFSIEACTFSPQISGEEDFRVLRGEELVQNYPFLSSYPDATPIGLVHARALPGGPVDPAFYRRIREEFLQQLKDRGPLDGLFLHMHGAVNVNGLDDAEGDFYSAIREVVGQDCLLAASYDLHGNLSERIMRSLDLLSAYRTAPHIDGPETVERAFALLVRCLRRNVRPYKALISVPVLFSGEKTSTEWEPAAGLYRRIPGVIDGDMVMDASILIGYVWVDEPRASASVVAFGLDPDRLQAAAGSLAKSFWEARDRFAFGVRADNVDVCIREAMSAPEQPVVISDSGDNPTAGGAGDTPFVLERLLAHSAKNALFASIADAGAVRQCEAIGPGGTVALSLGGKLDPVHAGPLAVTARVISLHRVPWTLSRDRRESIMNPIAVVDVAGVTAILTSRRTPFHRIIDFTSLGIDPHAYKIIVVKIGYLEPELKKLAAKALLALSPGAVDQDMTRIRYKRIRRPMYPFDPDFDWSP